MNSKPTVGFYGGKFLPLHKGHVYMIHEAMQCVDILYVVLSSNEMYDKQLCSAENFKYIPPEIRLEALGSAIQKIYGNINIIHIQDKPDANEHDWQYGAEMIKAQIPYDINYIFGSEPEYEEYFEELYPEARYILIDPVRETIPISATNIRRYPSMHWDYLTQSMQRFLAKKICIVGTESVGKSTMVQKLAEYYDAPFVPEVGRSYAEAASNQLTERDFDDIAMHHALYQRIKLDEGNRLLFVDSDAITTQYYLDMYKDAPYSQLIGQISMRQDFDLVIYLEPDVPWVADGLRFAGEPDERSKNNNRLKKMYRDHGIQLSIISGPDYDKRFDDAVRIVDRFLMSQ